MSVIIVASASFGVRAVIKFLFAKESQAAEIHTIRIVHDRSKQQIAEEFTCLRIRIGYPTSMHNINQSNGNTHFNRKSLNNLRIQTEKCWLPFFWDQKVFRLVDLMERETISTYPQQT